MTSVNSRIVTVGAGLASSLLLGIVPAFAGVGAPAPLVGVTGPYGIVAAILGYGGYLLVRQFRNRG
jgi:hypothetical protein